MKEFLKVVVFNLLVTLSAPVWAEAQHSVPTGNRPRVSNEEIALEEKALAAKDIILNKQKTALATAVFYLGGYYKTHEKKSGTASPFKGREKEIASRFWAVQTTAQAYQDARPFNWKGAAIGAGSAVVKAKTPQEAAIGVGVVVGKETLDANKEHLVKPILQESGPIFKQYLGSEVGDFATNASNFTDADNFKDFIKYAQKDPYFPELAKQLPPEVKELVSGNYVNESPSVKSFRKGVAVSHSNESPGPMSEEVGKIRHRSPEQREVANQQLAQTQERMGVLENLVKDKDLLLHSAVEMLKEQAEEAKKVKQEAKDEAERQERINLINAKANAAHATIGMMKTMAGDDRQAQMVLDLAANAVKLGQTVSVMQEMGKAAASPASYLNMYATAINIGMQLFAQGQQSDGNAQALRAIIKAIQELRKMMFAMDKKLTGINNSLYNMSDEQRRQIETLKADMNFRFNRIEQILRGSDERNTDRLRSMEDSQTSFQRAWVLSQKHQADVETEKYKTEFKQARAMLDGAPEKDQDKQGYSLALFHANMNVFALGATDLAVGPTAVGQPTNPLILNQFADSILEAKDPRTSVALVAEALKVHGLDISVPVKNSDTKEYEHKPVNMEFWIKNSNNWAATARSKKHQENLHKLILNAKALEDLHEMANIGLGLRSQLGSLVPVSQSGKPVAVRLLPLIAEYENSVQSLDKVIIDQSKRLEDKELNGYSPAIEPNKQQLSAQANIYNILPMKEGIVPCPGEVKLDKEGNTERIVSLPISSEFVGEYKNLIDPLFLVAKDMTRGGRIKFCYEGLDSTKKGRTTNNGRMESFTIRGYYEDQDQNLYPIFAHLFKTETLDKQNMLQVWQNNPEHLQRLYLDPKNRKDVLESETLEASKKALNEKLKNWAVNQLNAGRDAINQDLISETGEAGKALRKVESAKQILGTALWLAYGDAAESTPEIALAYHALPGRVSLSYYPDRDAATAASKHLLDKLLAGTTKDSDGEEQNILPMHSQLDATVDDLTKLYNDRIQAYKKTGRFPQVLAGLPEKLEVEPVIARYPEEIEDLDHTNELVRALRFEHPELSVGTLDSLQNALFYFFPARRNYEKHNIALKAEFRVRVESKDPNSPKESITLNGEDWVTALRLKQAHSLLSEDSAGPQLTALQTKNYLKLYALSDVPSEEEVNQLKQLWATKPNATREERIADFEKFLPHTEDIGKVRSQDRLAKIDTELRKRQSELQLKTDLIAEAQKTLSGAASRETIAQTRLRSLREAQVEISAIVKDLKTHDMEASGHVNRLKNEGTLSIKWVKSDRKEPRGEDPKACDGYDEDGFQYTPHTQVPRKLLTLRKFLCQLEKQVAIVEDKSNVHVYEVARALVVDLETKKAEMAALIPSATEDIGKIQEKNAAVKAKLAEIETLLTKIEATAEKQAKYSSDARHVSISLELTLDEWNRADFEVKREERRFGGERFEVTRERKPKRKLDGVILLPDL